LLGGNDFDYEEIKNDFYCLFTVEPFTCFYAK